MIRYPSRSDNYTSMVFRTATQKSLHPLSSNSVQKTIISYPLRTERAKWHSGLRGSLCCEVEAVGRRPEGDWRWARRTVPPAMRSSFPPFLSFPFPSLPFLPFLLSSSPLLSPYLRPLRDFRCQRPPHRVCGLSAYLVRSPRLSPAHCSHYAPSPPSSVCRFVAPSASQPAMPQSHAHTLFCSRFRPFTACSRVPRPISAALSAP